MQDQLNPLGQDQDGSPQEIIFGRINGSFRGWTGRARYELLTGQVWEQQSYSYQYRYSYMPRVVLVRAGETHRMRVEGTPGWVAVRRVK